VVDAMDESRMSRGTVLAAGIALARRLRETVRESRVGVILPASRGAVIGNLAVVLAGKIPVNLNFTAGLGALESAVRIAQLRTVITAGPVLKKYPDVPWPQSVIKLDEILPTLKSRIVFWRALVAILP